jgi:hypothetical protein
VADEDLVHDLVADVGSYPKFLPRNDNASSVWLGFELLYGTHPAHKY